MIQVKQKKCKGSGRAKDHGCGEVKYIHKYGLCIDCFKHWLYNTPEGLDVINKARIKAKKDIQKAQKQKDKKEREKITDYSSKLQDKINEIVRLIDIGLPCLARGYHAKQIHAGHVYSRGSERQMRYLLHNIHRQSAQSNHFQNEDGLLREGLVNEYGQEYFDYLTSCRSIQPLKYSNDDYHQFYKKASKIALELKKSGNVLGLSDRIEARNKINLELGIYDKEFCVFDVNKLH